MCCQQTWNNCPLLTRYLFLWCWWHHYSSTYVLGPMSSSWLNGLWALVCSAFTHCQHFSGDGGFFLWGLQNCFLCSSCKKPLWVSVTETNCKDRICFHCCPSDTHLYTHRPLCQVHQFDCSFHCWWRTRLHKYVVSQSHGSSQSM